MSFISKRRTALWVAGMERWATKEVEEHTQKTAGGKKKIDRHGMYCLGVVSAITIAKGTAHRGPRRPRIAISARVWLTPPPSSETC